ncbi:hypothetical protein [Paenibacillus crassostreae]|uniref:Uncharacterized protein n=1 Tax=Paenibacillus crassostreae TaxID=1763538 RepID=A0A167AJ77_9BACL|nr:hypothetical protein [Paenibacillus crassostreae]AOZ92376.1 hypothetical protein LPB68_09130 [Paenibacillus crassostreae]OAB71091.1 hypothetical protein PNBC_21280 [Paenibacillus crassostreae]
MFQDLNARLAHVKEQGRKHEKWEKRLEDLEFDRNKKKVELEQWGRHLNEEEQDVEKLTGMSLSNLIYTIIGKKEEKLEQEQLELLEVKVKYDEALRTMKDIDTQIQHVQQELSTFSGWRTEYDEIMQIKEEQMLRGNRKLMELMNQQADLSMTLKEINEANQAGMSVVESLDRAVDALKTASNWGTYDMLGGGMISTHLKHSNIDKAMEYVHEAQRDLGAFVRELRDVEMNLSIEIDIGEFLEFADYFFDGFISDWMVQGRINETLSQVEDKMDTVKELLSRLDQQYVSVESELNSTTRQYTLIIEQAE